MHTCSALAFGLMRSIVVIVDNTRRVREDKESVRSCDNNATNGEFFQLYVVNHPATYELGNSRDSVSI